MAFSYTVTHRSFVGDTVRAYGTYTSTGGDTGGDIDTQMDVCDFIKLSVPGATVLTTESVANESFPCNGHAVTIKTPANEVGQWWAEGRGVGY